MELLDEIATGCGPVGLLSSEEFLPQAASFDEALLAETGKRISLLLSADARGAHQSARLAKLHFERLGAGVTVVDVFRREQAVAERLPQYDVLYIGGGDPSRLLACVRDTPLWSEALARWRAGAALAGSSAGAMALCRACLEPEPGASTPERWSVGLGPLAGFAVAVHASTRPASWLKKIAATAPVPLIALDDATGVILTAGKPPILAGPGRVWQVETHRF